MTALEKNGARGTAGRKRKIDKFKTDKTDALDKTEFDATASLNSEKKKK